MLYTEDFCMRYYAGFSQIGSHICNNFYCHSTTLGMFEVCWLLTTIIIIAALIPTKINYSIPLAIRI